MIATWKAVLAVDVGFLVGFGVGAWYCDRLVAQGVKRLMGRIGAAPRAKILEAAIPSRREGRAHLEAGLQGCGK